MISGIDVSTRQVAIVLLDDRTDHADSYTVEIDPAARGLERAAVVRERMPGLDFWRRNHVRLAGIEDPYGQNRGTVKALALITGAVVACLPPTVYPFAMAPTEWKRETVGNPVARKDDVAEWCAMRWTDIPSVVDQDEFDAYAIAYAARAINLRGVAAIR